MKQNQFLESNPLSEPLDAEALVEQYYQALYRFAFGLTGNENDAADLTQDTYRVLLTKGGAIRDPRKVKSWLFTTLYRRFLGRRRRAERFSKTPLESLEWEMPAATTSPENALDGSLVVAALQGLEEKYQAPLAMFYLEEFSYKEIAAALDLPIGTVMSRLARGKERLRQRLQESPALPITAADAARDANWPRDALAHTA